jgi:hypothetical protein
MCKVVILRYFIGLCSRFVPACGLLLCMEGCMSAAGPTGGDMSNAKRVTKRKRN